MATIWSRVLPTVRWKNTKLPHAGHNAQIQGILYLSISLTCDEMETWICALCPACGSFVFFHLTVGRTRDHVFWIDWDKAQANSWIVAKQWKFCGVIFKAVVRRCWFFWSVIKCRVIMVFTCMYLTVFFRWRTPRIVDAASRRSTEGYIVISRCFWPSHDSWGSRFIWPSPYLLPLLFLSTFHPLLSSLYLAFWPWLWLRCVQNDHRDEHCGISIDILALVCERNRRWSWEPTTVLDFVNLSSDGSSNTSYYIISIVMRHSTPISRDPLTCDHFHHDPGAMDQWVSIFNSPYLRAFTVLL